MTPVLTHSNHSRISKIALVTLLGFMALFLRTWNLQQRGLYYHDEGTYLENGRYYSTLLKQAFQILFTHNATWASLMDSAHNLWVTGGSPWLHAKPTYEFSLVALCTLINPCDNVGLFFSAGLGTITVLIPVLFLRMTNYPHAGFFTSALLMVSIFHLHYSRSAMSQAFSFFWITSAIIAILNTLDDKIITRKARCVIGLSLGFALTTHYNLFWLPALSVCCFAVWEWEDKSSWRKWVWNGIIGIGWITLPALIFEIPHRILLWILKSRLDQSGYDGSHIIATFPTYFQQVFSQMTSFSSDKSFSPLSPLFFPNILFTLESAPLFLMFCFGVVFILLLCLRKRKLGLFLFGLIAIPGVLWTHAGYPGPRSFLSILLPLALGASLLLSQLTNKWRPQLTYAFSWLFLISVFTLQLEKSIPLLNAQSPWKKASLLLKSMPEKACFAESGLSDYNRPMLRFYSPCGNDTINPPLQAFLVDGTILTSEIKWPDSSLYVNAFQFSSNLDQGMLMEESLALAWVEKYRKRLISNSCTLKIFRPI